MEKFVTQFTMGGVRTNATVQVLGENRFDVTLHFSDAFEAGELTPGEDEKDATIIRNENGTWEIEGESKIAFTGADIQDLGGAIERSYLKI